MAERSTIEEQVRKRVLARKEYAAKVSGSTENVPDDIRD